MSHAHARRAWEYEVPFWQRVSAACGPAVDECYELEDGTLWITNGEYTSQVNFCPYTGRKARTPIPEEPPS